MSLPTSGPLAGFGIIADGMNELLQADQRAKAASAAGKINLDRARTTATSRDQTKTNVDEALGSNSYAAFDDDARHAEQPGDLGRDSTTSACPTCSSPPARRTGATSRTTRGRSGLGLDYFTESVLWAQWLQNEHPELKTVAEVTFNNDFGQIYHRGFAYATKDTDVKVVEQQTHEATAAEPRQPVHDAGRDERRRAADRDHRARSAPRRWRRSRSRPTGTRW